MEIELQILGALLTIAGLVVYAFAKPIADLNERVYEAMPSPLQRFSRWANGGAHLNSPSRVTYNRVAGLLVAALGVAFSVVALIRGNT